MYRHFILFLILFVCLATSANAQLGVNLHSSWWSGKNQEQIRLQGNEQAVGLSWWLRLQKQRLEFHPEIYLAQSHTVRATELGGTVPVEEKSGINLGIRLPAQAYFMDWDSDCMCPTFSKQGLWLKKGIFAWAAPGMEFIPHLPSLTLEGGAGLDIGLGNIFTLVPMIGYRYATRQAGLDNPASHLIAQLRLFVRWDKENFFR
ncbi:MAG: hypothetical protein KDC28_11935 [Saprospiraceae bacterium]|nr:hypothetical protein [Saprospiraceae bacterium]MCB9319268.1 hypothetical protein [Lewinellaceae bacterium]